MKLFYDIFPFVVVALIAYCIGFRIGKEKVNQRNIDLGRYYKNITVKQAAQIQKIQDRLVYLSIGELEDFLDFMKDDSDEGFGADEDYPVLCIVNPLKEEEANLNLDE